PGDDPDGPRGGRRRRAERASGPGGDWGAAFFDICNAALRAYDVSLAEARAEAGAQERKPRLCPSLILICQKMPSGPSTLMMTSRRGLRNLTLTRSYRPIISPGPGSG